ncbi:hypothetical protein PG993_002250 [Apiospora rasikravindrae]|uniref:Secreted protein n=1 Tax=Apiospora rasikravindrae TaxID=990691 RepID=A0ABR1TW47_9PEZI
MTIDALEAWLILALPILILGHEPNDHARAFLPNGTRDPLSAVRFNLLESVARVGAAGQEGVVPDLGGVLVLKHGDDGARVVGEMAPGHAVARVDAGSVLAFLKHVLDFLGHVIDVGLVQLDAAAAGDGGDAGRGRVVLGVEAPTFAGVWVGDEHHASIATVKSTRKKAPQAGPWNCEG